MQFEFATATRIIFGEGSVGEIPIAAKRLGERALIVTGRSQARAAGLIERLSQVKLGWALFSTDGEPTIELVRQGVRFARDRKCDLVIGFGGGSTIDAAKAIAALIPNSGEPLDYLEVVGKGEPLPAPSAPFIAVPTTAGTGAEVTRNAVLASPEHGVKASLRSPYMLASLAVVDPELTLDLPPAVTASTGLDALTQLIEPFVSCRANAFTDMFCIEGMRRASGALLRAYTNGGDRVARRDMSFASLLGGLALANAGLGAVHGFAAPVGGAFPAPHGAVCAALLPHVMAVNVRALRARAQTGEKLKRYETVARILTGNPDASAEEGSSWVAGICGKLKIPPLGSYGIRQEDIPPLVSKASKASSMKGNPIVLTEEELNEILMRAL